MKKILFLLMLLPLLVHAQIYRSVDKAGNVTFSDKPTDGAKQINLPQPQTYEPPSASDSIPDEITLPDQPPIPGVAYHQVTIASPTEQQTLRNNDGKVSVIVSMDPPLAAGHKLAIYLDGVKAGESSSSPAFLLTNVFRGKHDVQAKIFSSKGKMLKASKRVTFFMQRVTLNSPKGRVSKISPLKQNIHASKLGA